MSRALLAALLLAAAARADDPAPRKPVKLPPLAEEKYADEKAAKATADELEKQFAGKTQPEAIKMLLAILRGSQMGPREGWFGPAQSRFSWEWLAKKHKLDEKAKGISAKEFVGPAELFSRLDRDGDGTITAGDLDWSDNHPYVQQMSLVTRFFRRLDADGNSKLTPEDFDAFFKHVSKGKDHISPEDLRMALLNTGPGGFTPGDGPSTQTLVKGLYASEVGSLQEGPSVGETAPDFTLKTIDGKESVQLSKLVGPKPIVLVFGNFTCGPFRAIFPEADSLRERYKDQVTFVMVYVREAHPDDGWKMTSNTRVGVSVNQPTTQAERVEVCQQFIKKVKPGMKVVVDDISDTAGNLYSGMPARFYVIDPKGRVAFKSGRGPFGFKPVEMEQALAMTLLETSEKPAPKNEKLSWKLPEPKRPQLPAWASLADSLPRTTARMLELDYLHRENNPLGNALAAKVRLAVAMELGSAYGVTNADADVTRHGERFTLGTEDAVVFARKLTREGHAITDAEFAAVLKRYGPEMTTALVHTVAYANFHARVLAGMGVKPQADPPVQLSFDAATVTAFPSPVRPPWDDVKDAKHDGLRLRPEWSKGEADALAIALDSQKARTLRIPLPEASRFDGLAGREKEQAQKILWNTVSSGYQPLMTRAWFACLNEFYAESKVDRVFTNSMFWVVTRTNDCFY